MNLPIIGSIKNDVVDAPVYLVAQCRTYKEAVELCMALSIVKRSRSNWADLLGMTSGTLSMILNGSGERKRNLDPALFTKIQKLAGNRAINQWFDMDLKGSLNHQNEKTKRINDLKAELAALEAV